MAAERNAVYKGNHEAMPKMGKPCKVMTLDKEDAPNTGNNTGDNYIMVENLFSSLMTDIFEGSNVN